MQSQDLGQIPNLNGASFRSRNNFIAQAHASKHSGPTEPIVVYPNMEWADTGSGLLKIRDTANTRWWALGRLGTSDTPPETYNKGGTILSDAEIARLGSFRSVTEFGVKGDGVTDNTAKIADAHAAMPADGTGALIFPAGRYCVSNKTVFNKPGRYLGAGKECCTIVTSHPTAAILEIGNEAEVSGMALTASATRTGGYFVDVASGLARLRDIKISNAFHGIRVRNGTAIVNLSGVSIRDIAPTYGVGIQIEGGFNVVISNLIMDNPNGNCNAGIMVKNVGDLNIYDASIIRSGKCVALEPEAGDVIASIFAAHSFFDTSEFGLFARTAVNGSIVRCSFHQCWFSSHSQYGVYISSGHGGLIDGIDFTLAHVFANRFNGISVLGASTFGVDISASKIAGNGGAGVAFSESTAAFSVMNSRIGRTCGFGGNQYGVFVDTGCNQFRIIGNDLIGNTTPLINAGTTWIVKDNVGVA